MVKNMYWGFLMNVKTAVAVVDVVGTEIGSQVVPLDGHLLEL